MKLKYKFTIQELSDFYAAVPIGSPAPEFNGILRINQTGKDILELMQNEITEKEIVQSLMHKYNADEAEVYTQVQKFIKTLRKSGIL